MLESIGHVRVDNALQYAHAHVVFAWTQTIRDETVRTSPP